MYKWSFARSVTAQIAESACPPVGCISICLPPFSLVSNHVTCGQFGLCSLTLLGCTMQTCIEALLWCPPGACQTENLTGLPACQGHWHGCNWTLQSFCWDMCFVQLYKRQTSFTIDLMNTGAVANIPHGWSVMEQRHGRAMHRRKSRQERGICLESVHFICIQSSHQVPALKVCSCKHCMRFADFHVRHAL